MFVVPALVSPSEDRTTSITTLILSEKFLHSLRIKRRFFKFLHNFNTIKDENMQVFFEKF